MQLTRYTDYGLRILMYLAVLPPGRLSSINEVCETFDLSRNHVNKIVHQLGKLGLLETRRGKSGGIALRVPQEEINIGKVVSDLESSLTAIDCQKPACRLLPVCRLKGMFSEATLAFIKTLEQYTLADLTRNPDRMVQVLDIQPLDAA
ncbi:MAG: Rrf2 family transcriptional regulator [bacterium]